MSRYAVKKRRRGKKRCQARRWKVKKKKRKKKEKLERVGLEQRDRFDGAPRTLPTSAANRRGR